MARAVEKIEQDLAHLEEAIALLATQMYSTYSQYLTLLGQAMRQQLILASYQICTQGYPEAFLSLSLNQRQALQQALRQIAGQAQTQLRSHLEQANPFIPAATEQPAESPHSLLSSSEPAEEAIEPEPEALTKPVAAEASPNATTPPEPSVALPTKPEQLLAWQKALEEAIAQVLQMTSIEANRLLQHADLIPKKLPPAVLEAAAKVDAAPGDTSGAPHLLNLLMETETEEDKEDSTLTRIIAINLRLSEIEFTDPPLSAIRNHIRSLAAKGSKLQREYHKKQRERAVAQAEAAWRSIWFEE